MPIIIIVAVAVVLIFLAFQSVPRTELPLFAADASLYGVSSGIIGMAGLAIGGYGVYLSHRAATRGHEQAFRASLGSRFQQGAQLLASDRSTAQISGMQVLATLAAEEPELYRVEVLKALSAFVFEVNATKWESKGLWRETPQAFAGEWESSDLRAVDALVTIAQIAPSGCSWPNHPSICYRNRFVIEGLYACDMFVEEEKLDNVHFRRMIGKSTRFFRCSLRNSVIHIATGGNVIFDDCDLTDAIIIPTDAALNPVTYSPTGPIKIQAGETAGLKIGQVPYEEWKTLEGRSLAQSSLHTLSPQWIPDGPVQKPIVRPVMPPAK